MADDADMTPVVLVDRAMQGGFEILYGGRPHVFKSGRMKLTSYADLARYVFSHDHQKVWTLDGQFVHRVAIEDAPGYEGIAAALANELGPEILIADPIELDTTRVENWSMEGADRRVGRFIVERINVPPQELRERLANTSDRLAPAER